MIDPGSDLSASSDPIEQIEHCYAMGWTDGLPVVPPIAWRVAQMLETVGLTGSQELGSVKFRRRRIIAEQVAANAVMAGCLPEYFPVVLACVRGMLREPFGLHVSAASTHSPALLLVINGPIRQRIGVNCANNAFSPGWRANATIGRAVRLMLLNLCGYDPAYFDGGTMGNPAKYSYCVGEYEEASPWEPFHVERGFAPGQSAVTLFCADAPRQINSRLTQEPELILGTVADMMLPVGNGSTNPDEGGFLIVFGPEHAATLASRGWTRTAVREFLFEKARRPLADFKRLARIRGEIESGDEARDFPLVHSPRDIFVLVAGSLAGQYSLVIPTRAHARVISEPIET